MITEKSAVESNQMFLKILEIVLVESQMARETFIEGKYLENYKSTFSSLGGFLTHSCSFFSPWECNNRRVSSISLAAFHISYCFDQEKVLGEIDQFIFSLRCFVSVTQSALNLELKQVDLFSE